MTASLPFLLCYNNISPLKEKWVRMGKKRHLTILPGGKDRQVRLNGVSLAIIPDSFTPLPVDVRVFEEDTFLVLSVDPVMRHTEEHPILLMTRVMATPPKAPGTIVVNHTSWYAVIHDLDADPSMREEWVAQAYLAAFSLAEKNRVRRLGIPLLGSVHGSLSQDKSLDLLRIALQSLSLQHLEKICILVPVSDRVRAWQMLERWVE